jgi:hypothetical protein
VAPGSIVIYTADPLLYGKMLILEVVADGRLLCESIHTDREGQYARELFDAHELELAERWQLPHVTQTGLPGKP